LGWQHSDNQGLPMGNGTLTNLVGSPVKTAIFYNNYMTDITKCSGENCPMKESCYRYTAEADTMQSYFIEPPIKDGKCEHYWEIA